MNAALFVATGDLSCRRVDAMMDGGVEMKEGKG